MNARQRTSASTNGDGEFVTHARCKERHGSTRWTLIFLGGFFLAMLGVAGAAYDMAANSNERVGKVEARQDALDKHVIARLDEIWKCVQKD